MKLTATPPMSRNLQKHTNPNPLHRWLLDRFHKKVAALAAMSLHENKAGASPLLLEVGCGEGFAISSLRGLLSDGLWQGDVRFLGLDTRWDALDFARERSGQGHFSLGDAYHLPFGAGSFPLVLCLEVLEHLEDPWIALEEIKRVSGGDVIVSVPNQPWFSLANFLRGKNWPIWGEDPDHVHHWTARQFTQLLRPKLHVKKVVYSFPWVIALGSAPSPKSSPL